jgi:hypothetical protein
MKYKIKITGRDWASCSSVGGPIVTFKPGVYSVPDQMSEFLAQRCVRSGRGHIEEDAPKQKMRGRAPENKAAS